MKSENETKTKSNKKIIVIISIIVILLIAIVGGAIALLYSKNKENNDSIELSAWEDAYVLYLSKQDSILNNSENIEMQLIKINDNQIPTLLIRYDNTYEGKTSKMLEIYQVDENGGELAKGSFSGDCKLKMLYNKENSEYEIFVYRDYDESYVYTSLGEFVESAIETYKEKQASKMNVTDFTFSKTNEDYKKSVEAEFNTKFIEVNCDDEINDWIKYNKDNDKEDIINLIKEEIDKNKTSDSVLTEEKKIEVLDIAKQEQKALEEENAKKEAEEKAKEEEEKSKLTIGKYTLQYGKYTSINDLPQGSITVILNSDKTCSYSGLEPSGGSKIINQKGTYEIQLNKDNGYGKLVNWIILKLNDGTEAPFIVNGNNDFGSQWLGFKYSGGATSSNNSTSNNTNSNSTSTQNKTNMSQNTNSSISENPDMPNAISKDEALKLAQNKWGTKAEETGYDMGYSYVAWIKDEQGMQYYVFTMRWLVGDHWSFIDTVCISADGKTYKEIGMPVSYENGEIVKQFDAEGNL